MKISDAQERDQAVVVVDQFIANKCGIRFSFKGFDFSED